MEGRGGEGRGGEGRGGEGRGGEDSVCVSGTHACTRGKNMNATTRVSFRGGRRIPPLKTFLPPLGDFKVPILRIKIIAVFG